MWWSNLGFTRAIHCCITLGWKSPPHPQNTSAVVENLKYRLGSTGSLVFPKQTDPKRDPKSRPDRSKAGPKKNQIVRNILSSAPFILDFYFKFPIFFKFPTTADVILRMKSWYQNRRTGSEQMRNWEICPLLEIAGILSGRKRASPTHAMAHIPPPSRVPYDPSLYAKGHQGFFSSFWDRIWAE